MRSGLHNIGEGFISGKTANLHQIRSGFVRAADEAVAAGNDAFTTLLLHCDGADASTTFTDSAIGGTGNPHTVTPNGHAQVKTDQSKFGGASARFDGTGDFLSIADHADFEFGTGDFTIDFWVRFAVLEDCDIVSKRGVGVGPFLFIAQAGGANLNLYMSSNGSSFDIASASSIKASLAINTWYHIALCRSGSTFYKFCDGASAGTITSSAGLVNNAIAVTLGANTSGTADMNGWLDEVRFSKGVARWTAPFTPPTSAYS